MLEKRLKEIIAEVPDFPKPGISFKDITTLLLDAPASADVLNHMVKTLAPLKPDVVVGMESRGFILGFALAQRLGIGFVPVRKPGKLPRETFSESYDLEYGSASLELHKDDLKAGSRVLIHDDLLATGGTAKATIELCERAGAEVVGLHFIAELSFLKARESFPSAIPLFSEVRY